MSLPYRAGVRANEASPDVFTQAFGVHYLSVCKLDAIHH